MVATQDEFNLREYFSIAKRRAWYLVIPFTLIAVVSLRVIRTLPPVYSATGTILVESQQIPSSLVQTTITGYAGERISFIQRRVMTRKRLLEIVDKYQLFPEQRDKVSDSVLVDQMRERVSLELISADAGGRRAGSTIAFEVSFEHRDPEVCATITTELVTMFLAENVKTRTQRASETTEFLDQEAHKLKEAVDSIEEQIAYYKQEHSEALPEHLSLHITMLTRNENQLRTLEQDINMQQQEIRFLEIELDSADSIGAMRNVQAGRALSPADQLRGLQAALIEESAVYGSAHPSVRALQRKVMALKRVVNPEAMGEEGGNMDSTSERIEVQIAGAKARVESLQAEKTEREKETSTLEARILLTPQVERGLKGLSRDYENALKKYQDVRAKQMEAQLAESLEQSEKAERFILLEPPTVPDEPIRPDRKKLLLMGFFLALGSGLGGVFAAEFMDKTIRGPEMLTAILKMHPLAVIPYIETASERRTKRIHHVLIVVVLIFLVIGAVALIHFFITPWDVLFYKVLDKIGAQ